MEGSGHVACRTCIAHVVLQRARTGIALRHEVVGRRPVPVPRVRRAVPLEEGRGATDGHIHGDGSVAVGKLVSGVGVVVTAATFWLAGKPVSGAGVVERAVVTAATFDVDRHWLVCCV